MIDQSKIGQSFPPFSFEVTRGKIHELALAIGDLNPIYHSKEAAQAAGFPDVPLFPTSPTTFSFWADTGGGRRMADLGVDMSRALHGEEQYEYLAPIYAGDTVTGVTTLVEGKTRQGSNGAPMDILTTETRYTNQNGQPVLNVRRMAVVI